MPRVAAADPIRDFKFIVEIQPPPSGRLHASFGGNITNLGFAVVSGVSVQNEVIPYREGGMNTHPHKMVGQSDFAPVTFSRGTFFEQDQLYRWQQFMHAWSSATGATRVGAGNLSVSSNNDYRCTIGVRVLDHPASGATYVSDPSKNGGGVNTSTLPTTRIGFVLYNCWPGAFAMSDLNAGNSGILIQQLTVHHEGFVLVNSNSEYTNALQYN
jgi:phage tail-like protein